jgi:hypothetical protein
MHVELACPVSSVINTGSLKEITDESFTYRNGGTGLKSNWVDSIICANDEGDVGVFEVIIDFIHFQYN